MMLPEINHVEEIKHFLSEIRSDIETITPTVAGNNLDLPAIDKYLYEINSFYYHSFETRFMPIYTRKIEQEMASLLHLSQEEGMLKKDLLATLKRYAQLYNQVKTLTAILGSYRSDINSKLLVVVNKKEHLTTELLYAIKQLQDSLEQLHSIIKPLQEILGSRDNILIKRYTPLNVRGIQMVALLDLNNLQTVKSWNSFMLNLQLLKKFYSKLAREDDLAVSHTIVNDLTALANKTGKKLNAPMRSFVDDNLQSFFIKHMELINLYLEKGNLTRVKEIARESTEWLSDLLHFLDQSQTYMSKINPDLLINLINRITPLDVNLVTELEKRTTATLSAVNEIVEELAPASDPDFGYFSLKVKQIIDTAYSYYYLLTDHQNIRSTGFLYADITRVITNLSFLESKTELLNDKHQQGEENSATILTLVNMLDAYLNHLANTRADLERLMAPRNLNRIWKDMNIRIERVSLEKGQIFPPDYQYLVDKWAVETRITDDNDMTVLLEEGDIFIIRVDDIMDEEVPYIIVSMKG